MDCFIALGSNMPRDRQTPADVISHALWHFAGEGLEILQQSEFYRIPAHPPGSTPDLISAAVHVRSDKSPDGIIECLARIEAALGRPVRNGTDRYTIDLELVAAVALVLPDEITVREAMSMEPEPDMLGIAPKGGTVLPHPRLHVRPDVLVPLAAIAPDWRHPVIGASPEEMLSGLDRNAVVSVEALGEIPPFTLG